MSNKNSSHKQEKRQYIYDEKLKCYYDPETNEYF